MLSEKALEEMTLEEVRKRWPRITAHIIAESLGYAVPDVAAMIVQDALLGKENHCEWIVFCYQNTFHGAPLTSFLYATRSIHQS